MTPVWFTTVEEKLELVETWRPYDVAPEEAFQVSIGFVEVPVAPFDGEDKLGGEGGVVPAVPTSLTSSKYSVLPPVPSWTFTWLNMCPLN